jgi:hypothetical protein
MSLARRGDQELVAEFNAVLATRGWVTVKAQRLVDLRDELAGRGLAPPIEEHDGVFVFGHGRRYEIVDGVLCDVTGETPR